MNFKLSDHNSIFTMIAHAVVIENKHAHFRKLQNSIYLLNLSLSNYLPRNREFENKGRVDQLVSTHFLGCGKKLKKKNRHFFLLPKKIENPEKQNRLTKRKP